MTTRSPGSISIRSDSTMTTPDVRRRARPGRVDIPAPPALRVLGEGALRVVVGPDVAGVAAVDRRVQRLGDGRRQRIVHLGDEQREHIVGIRAPLLAGAQAQAVEGFGFDGHPTTVPPSPPTGPLSSGTGPHRVAA